MHVRAPKPPRAIEDIVGLLNYAQQNFKNAYDEAKFYRVDNPAWQDRQPRLKLVHAAPVVAIALILPLALGWMPWLIVSAVLLAITAGVVLLPYRAYVNWAREWQMRAKVVVAAVVLADEKLYDRAPEGDEKPLSAFLLLSYDKRIRTDAARLQALASRLKELCSKPEGSLPSNQQAMVRLLKQDLECAPTGRWKVSDQIARNDRTWLVGIKVNRDDLPNDKLSGSAVLCFSLDRDGDCTQLLPPEHWWRPELADVLAGRKPAEEDANQQMPAVGAYSD